MAAAQVEWGKVALSEGALCAKSVSQGLPLFQSFTRSLFILTALCGFGCRLFFLRFWFANTLLFCISFTKYVHGLCKDEIGASARINEIWFWGKWDSWRLRGRAAGLICQRTQSANKWKKAHLCHTSCVVPPVLGPSGILHNPVLFFWELLLVWVGPLLRGWPYISQSKCNEVRDPGYCKWSLHPILVFHKRNKLSSKFLLHIKLGSDRSHTFMAFHFVFFFF